MTEFRTIEDPWEMKRKCSLNDQDQLLKLSAINQKTPDRNLYKLNQRGQDYGCTEKTFQSLPYNRRTKGFICYYDPLLQNPKKLSVLECITKKETRF